MYNEVCFLSYERELVGTWKLFNFCFIDYSKAFDSVGHKNCGKLLKRWEYQTPYLPPGKLYVVQKAS